MTAPLVGTTAKARALARMTIEEQEALLAAAGALGLSNDDDPFWAIQAVIVQLQSSLRDTRAAANEAMGLALDVAKSLRPTTAIAQTTVEKTVAAAWDRLAADTSQAIAVELAEAAKKTINAQADRSMLRGEVIGLAAGSVGAVALLLVGIALGQGGWTVLTAGTAVQATTLGGLLIAQAVVVASLAAWLTLRPSKS